VLSIDVVPAFEAGMDVYEIPDKVTGKWIKTNPKKHMEQAICTNSSVDGGFFLNLTVAIIERMVEDGFEQSTVLLLGS
jgi:hypothetical protein